MAAAGEGGRKTGGGGGSGRGPAGGHEGPGLPQAYALTSLRQRKPAGLCAGSLQCVIDYYM